MITSGWSNSTGWASATMIFLTVPPVGAVIGFITFIASMISRVSPALTVSPTLMNGSAPGSGDRKAVPTIGDLTVSPAMTSSAGGGGGQRPARGGRRGGRSRRGGGREAAADLDPALAVLDLDFGQPVLGQQLGELLHQLGVDPHCAVLGFA